MKKLFTLFSALLFIASASAQNFDIIFPKNTHVNASVKEFVIKGYLKNQTNEKVTYTGSFLPKGWEWNFKWEYKVIAGGKKFVEGKGSFEVSANDSALIEIHIMPKGNKGNGKLLFSFGGSDDPFSFVEDDVNIIVSKGKKEAAPKPKKE